MIINNSNSNLYVLFPVENKDPFTADPESLVCESVIAWQLQDEDPIIPLPVTQEGVVHNYVLWDKSTNSRFKAEQGIVTKYK